MRALILSCNTGGGHNSCAKAIKEVYDAKGKKCDITDALRFVSPKFSRFICWGHIFIYRNIPWFFNWCYRFAEKHTGAFQNGGVLYGLFAKGAKNLYEFIIKGNYDTVICTHPFAALILTEAKKRYDISVKSAFLATDYTCSPSVQDSALDYYFIPDELLANEFVCTNIPKEKIVASGIPVRQCFYAQVEKDVAKKKFGLDTDCKHIVVACGSMGCGPIKKLVKTLSEQLENIAISVVCGTNEKLKLQLEREYDTNPNVHILGYVVDMSTLIDSAELYVTKAGGISVTEGAIKHIPMVYIEAIGGCERYNASFYCKMGGAKRGRDVAELTRFCQEALKSDMQKIMRNALSNHTTYNAAQCIYETLSQIPKEERGK